MAYIHSTQGKGHEIVETPNSTRWMSDKYLRTHISKTNLILAPWTEIANRLSLLLSGVMTAQTQTF